MWCRVGIAGWARVMWSNDIWGFREPHIALSQGCMYYQVRFTFPSLLALSLSSLPFFASLCVYIHFSLNNRLRQVSVCVLLVQIQKKIAGEQELFYVHPEFSKIYFRRQRSLASSDNSSYLPGIFRCNNWHVGLIGELLGRRARERHYRSNILLRVCCYASHLKRHETKMRLVVV